MSLRKERVLVDDRDLFRICHLYYREEKTQEEISSIFGLSRFKVNRLLKEARKRGFVTIQINDPLEKLTETEVELTKRFGLKGSIVVRATGSAESPPRNRSGRQAAPVPDAYHPRLQGARNLVGKNPLSPREERETRRGEGPCGGAGQRRAGNNRGERTRTC